MHIRLIVLVACAWLGAPPTFAATEECASKETAAALAAHDKNVAAREENIAEMRQEIAQTGGSTDDQKKVLQAFEDKIEQMKTKRAALVEACAGKAP